MNYKIFIDMPQCENINIFGYLGGGGVGGGWLIIRLGPSLVHIYPLIYINLHVKIWE